MIKSPKGGRRRKRAVIKGKKVVEEKSERWLKRENQLGSKLEKDNQPRRIKGEVVENSKFSGWLSSFGLKVEVRNGG